MYGYGITVLKQAKKELMEEHDRIIKDAGCEVNELETDQINALGIIAKRVNSINETIKKINRDDLVLH